MADLSKEMQKWIETRLSEWGAWEFSGLDSDVKTNMIYRLMKSVEAERLAMREMCNDELGMLINQVVGYYIKQADPQAYKYLEAKYIYGLAVRRIAKYNRELSDENKALTLRQWENRVGGSIKAAEYIVAKMLNQALKNHKNAFILQKFAFFS